MVQHCDQYDQCQKERLEGAKFEGRVLAELEGIKSSIETGFKSLWKETSVNRDDIKALYFRVGMISGGTSLIVSLVVVFAERLIISK